MGCCPNSDQKPSYSYLFHLLLAQGHDFHLIIIVKKLARAMAMLPQSTESIKPRVFRTLPRIETEKIGHGEIHELQTTNYAAPMDEVVVVSSPLAP